MNMKKYAIGVTVAALVVATVGFAIGNHRGDDSNENKKENKVVAKVEYTGNVTLGLSGFAADIKDADCKNEELSNYTGKVVLSAIGFADAMSGYENYLGSSNLTEEEIKDVTQKLDVATGVVPEESVVSGYTNLGISNAYEYLNVRSGPSLDDKIIGKMPGYCACEILEENNGWYKIKSGDVEGYVYAELMVTGYEANIIALEQMTERLYVTTDVLNVREEPNTDCPVGTQVSNGEILEIVEDEKDGWYKININNLVGYVSAEFVEKRNILPTAVEVKEVIATVPTPSIDSSQLSNEVSQQAVDLINYSMQFLGNPYVYGGNSLITGTDCSGFIKLVFAQFGYDLPRSSSDYLWVGTTIPLGSIKPGDILLYMYGGSIGHVALYIGNGQIIHASTPSTGIVIGNAYYTTPYAAVRVIP